MRPFVTMRRALSDRLWCIIGRRGGKSRAITALLVISRPWSTIAQHDAALAGNQLGAEWVKSTLSALSRWALAR
jgi:hypothetical protein